MTNKILAHTVRRSIGIGKAVLLDDGICELGMSSGQACEEYLLPCPGELLRTWSAPSHLLPKSELLSILPQNGGARKSTEFIVFDAADLGCQNIFFAGLTAASRTSSATGSAYPRTGASPRKGSGRCGGAYRIGRRRFDYP